MSSAALVPGGRVSLARVTKSPMFLGLEQATTIFSSPVSAQNFCKVLVAELADLPPGDSILVALQVDEESVARGVGLGWFSWIHGDG